MKKAILSALALSLLCAPMALASGSSAPVGGGGYDSNGTTVTETVKCIVAYIHDNGTIFIKDSENDAARALPITKKTRFVAQDKNEFGGRKKLQVADLEVGRKLQVTVHSATGQVVKVRVLKKS